MYGCKDPWLPCKVFHAVVCTTTTHYITSPLRPVLCRRCKFRTPQLQNTHHCIPVHPFKGVLLIHCIPPQLGFLKLQSNGTRSVHITCCCNAFQLSCLSCDYIVWHHAQSPLHDCLLNSLFKSMFCKNTKLAEGHALGWQCHKRFACFMIPIHPLYICNSLCRDGADTPIVCVHWRAVLTRERSCSKPFSVFFSNVSLSNDTSQVAKMHR